MYKKRLLVGESRNNCKSLFSQKKGQITIFIIIGILLLLVLLIVISIQKEIVTFKTEELIPTEKGKVENFLTSCISKIGDDALFKMGVQGGYIRVPDEIASNDDLHLRTSPLTVVPYWARAEQTNVPSLTQLKTRLDNYVQENLRSCLFEMEAFQETYDLVEKSDIVANTEIVESKVIFNVRWNVEVRNKAGEVVSELIDHSAESHIKLKKVHKIASRIIEKEMQSLKLEDLTQDLIALEHPDVPLVGMEVSCSKKKWDVQQAKETVQNLIHTNIRELKVKSTDFVEFPETLTYYQNHYIWDLGEEINHPEVSVAFNYDQNYPFYFEVTPREGNTMKSGQFGGTNLLSFLCLQNWKFTYDVVYPVLVQVRDETTGYNFNFAFTVHLIRNKADRREAEARTSNLFERSTNEDYCQEAKSPLTVYSYELVENEKTGVYDRTPLGDVNTTFSCLKYSCEMGTTNYDFGGSGAIAGYTMNFPYCVGGILRGIKEGYKETWQKVRTSPAQEVELELVPLFSFPAKQIKVVKHDLGSLSLTDLSQFDSSQLAPSQPLAENEVAFVKLAYQKETEEGVSSNAVNGILSKNFHEDELVLGSLLNEQLLQQENLDLLARADFTYEIEITVLDAENIIGGYKQNWTVSWSQLESARESGRELIIHTLSKESGTEEDMYGLIMGLEEYSLFVPPPEFK